MKTTIKLAVIALMVLSLRVNAQWNTTGDNATTGSLTIGGSINATGLNKRLFLGGTGGSTFGLAYSSSYPNYGIFYTEGSPDFVSISPNGNATNGIMNVFGDGNVGIGTAAPSGSISSNQNGLHIANNNVAYLSLESTSGTGKKYTMYTSPGGSLVFWDATSATLRGTIDSNGNWGIGTASPSHTLSVSSSANAVMELSSSTTGTWMDFENTGAAAGARVWTIGHLGPTGNFGIAQRDGIDEYRLVVDNDGNVGIGTTDPAGKLHIENPTGTNGTWLKFTEGVVDYRVSNEGGRLKISEGTNDRFVIRSGGNVGIGTTSPELSLEVNTGNQNGLRIKSSGIPRLELDAYEGNTLKSNWVLYANPSTSEFGIYDDNEGSNRFMIDSQGFVGIGTTDPKSKLAVNGDIRATEVTILADITVPDYVFEPDYELRTLKETKQYIEENKHLPEIPSAAEIGENGIDLGEMNMKLLKKIEELTLYQIELLEKLEQQGERLQEVENELNTLKK